MVGERGKAREAVQERRRRARLVKTLREKTPFTQAQLARILRVHYMTVSKWERPGSDLTPSQYELELLEAIAGVAQHGEAAPIYFDRATAALAHSGAAALQVLLQATPVRLWEG